MTRDDHPISRRTFTSMAVIGGAGVAAPAAFALETTNGETRVPVNYQLDRGLAIVEIDNAPDNIIDLDVLHGLEAAMERVRRDRPRAVLLVGANGLFSVGANPLDFQKYASQLDELLRRYLQIIQDLHSIPIPTIAGVHAICSSAGFELALGCDFIIAAEGTRFGFNEPRNALLSLSGGIQRVAERTGPARALEIGISGEHYDAALMERWNIVNHVVPAADFRAAAIALASRYAEGPTQAYGQAKHLLNIWRDQGESAADNLMPAINKRLLATHDAHVGLVAFARYGPRKWAAAPLPVFDGS